MTTVDFEARYQGHLDPWGYETSPYERDKYAATLRACGPGPFHRALELGASIGVFTALLAPRCRRVDTIDLAPTAVRRARDRLTAARNVHVRCGTIPDDLPGGPFDLVVASETLYYLDEPCLVQTLGCLEEAMTRGGRLVAVHWRPTGPERPTSAFEVHRILRAQPWLAARRRERSAEYLLDVLERI
jgi:SAM-dependent methyltransferase